MKSIIYQLSSDKFPRIRVGVGGPKHDMVSHVLGRFTNEERKLVDDTVKASGDAALEIIQNGIQTAMNKYNSFKSGQE